MKTYKIVLLALAMIFVLFLPRVARASEGLADLRGTGTSGACFAASVFVDGSYKMVVSCRELKAALTPEINKYVLWTEDAVGKQRRMGEIVSGKFFGQVDEPFARLFVTAERNPYTNKPSEEVLLAGDMREIGFGPGIAPGKSIITPTPTPTKESLEAQQNQDIPVREGNLGSVVTTIFKIVLLGFGALLVVVGVTSFLSRRRGI